MDKLGTVSFEIGMVVAVIATLLVAVVFYLNIRHLVNRTSEVKRLNDTIAISEAISLYTVEKGHLPPEISVSEMEISNIDGKCNNFCSKGLKCINLFLSILPHLQIRNLNSLDGFSVQLGQSGMVTVRACPPNLGKVIEVTR